MTFEQRLMKSMAVRRSMSRAWEEHVQSLRGGSRVLAGLCLGRAQVSTHRKQPHEEHILVARHWFILH